MENDALNLGTLFRLIRDHRTLILTVVGVVVVLTVLIYLVLPLFGVVLYQSPPDYVGRIELTLPHYPAEVRSVIDFDLPVWSVGRFRNTALVSAAYQDTIGLPEQADEPGALSYVQESVRPQLSARWDARLRVLTVSFVAAQPEGIPEFLNSLEATVREEARLRTHDLLELNKAGLQTARDELVRDLSAAAAQDLTTLSGTVGAAFRENSALLLSYLRLAVEDLATERALESSALPWRAPADATVVERRDDSLLARRGRGMAIVLFAGLIFALLLAVVADYIRYLKNGAGSENS